jgi:uncharacterized protein (DUF983 family)
MEKPAKTNKLAIVSFVCGLLLVGLWLLQAVWSFPSANVVLAVTGLLTGLIALIQLRQKKGAEQGLVFAWLAILLVLFFLFCPIFFAMVMSWSGY